MKKSKRILKNGEIPDELKGLTPEDFFQNPNIINEYAEKKGNDKYNELLNAHYHECSEKTKEFRSDLEKEHNMDRFCPEVRDVVYKIATYKSGYYDQECAYSELVEITDVFDNNYNLY